MSFTNWPAGIGVGAALWPRTGPLAAFAAAGAPATPAQVLDNARLWAFGLVSSVTTFYLMWGALRYTASGGDPARVERAKQCISNAMLGYALAVLVPVILTVLQGILG